MSEWREYTLADIAAPQKKSIISGPFGSNISSKYFVESGIPVIRGNNLSLDIGKKFIDADFVFISEEKANELGTWAKKEDLIFTAAGTIGQVGILIGNNNFQRYIISNKQLRVTLNKSLVDILHAYYWFASPLMIDTIINCDTGSTIPLINLSVLKSLPIIIPPLPEQRAIASILSSLDDKIDLLHRQNKTLEAMAEALFRQWFVEEAEEGWEDCSLEDIANINPVYKLKKGDISSYLEMRNVSTSTFNPEGWYEREFSSGMKFKNGDTLLARITPCLENGKTCYVNFLDKDEIGWGSTEYIVIRMKKPFHPFISYILVKDTDFRDFAISSMSGSSGRQRAQASVIKEYYIKIPPLAIIEEFNLQLDGITPKLEKNAKQIRTLEKLRDTLLPKLMSGEVKIKYKENNYVHS